MCQTGLRPDVWAKGPTDPAASDLGRRTVWFGVDPGYGTSRRRRVMADYTAFENETRDRLNRMERELRYWRLGGILTLALAVVVVAGAMAQPPAKELRVETLRIVQVDGKDRIVLTA